MNAESLERQLWHEQQEEAEEDWNMNGRIEK